MNQNDKHTRKETNTLEKIFNTHVLKIIKSKYIQSPLIYSYRVLLLNFRRIVKVPDMAQYNVYLGILAKEREREGERKPSHWQATIKINIYRILKLFHFPLQFAYMIFAICCNYSSPTHSIYSLLFPHENVQFSELCTSSRGKLLI